MSIKRKIPQTLAGISVMLSAFLLLVVAADYKIATNTAKVVFKEQNQIMRATLLGEEIPTNQETLKDSEDQFADTTKNPFPENIIIGEFSLEKPAELEIPVQNSVQHHREIYNDKLKLVFSEPILKLETKEPDGTISWQKISSSQFNRQMGTVHFIYKIDNKLVKPFTGRYQIILN